MPSKTKMHFEISERKVLLRLFDIISVLVSLYLVGKFLEFNYFTITKTHFYWTIMLAVYINFFGTIFEMYNLQVASNQFQIIKNTLITGSITVLFYLLTPLFSPELPSNRLQVLIFYFVVLLSLLVWRMIYVLFLASHRFYQNVVLICDNNQVKELILGLQNIDPNYKIVGFVSSDSIQKPHSKSQFVLQIETANLVAFVKENMISEIVIASQKTSEISVVLYQQLMGLLQSGTSIREYTHVYESKTQKIPIQYIGSDFYRFLPLNRSNSNKLYLSFIRMVEIVISFLGLTIGFALIPIIFIGNILANKGTLFYTQERVGKGGVVFKIFKFRTMKKDAENNGAVFSTVNDNRITAFGKFLRKTRIDEFPQFINILKGDMALIGPRPERPFFVNEIAQIMPFYETRHIIKPGLTGWAQVNYSYGESIEESIIKLQYDLYYIKHRSLYLDLNIALKTITTVLFYRGQ
jgi:exopolysaccharide biosynthesis polyprenyl glycosylphosphotransferase